MLEHLQVSQAPVTGNAWRPALSPDGKVIAVVGFATVDNVLTRQVIFVDTATGAERSVPIRDGGGADGVEWLDPGHLVLSHIGRDDAGRTDHRVLESPERPPGDMAGRPGGARSR